MLMIKIGKKRLKLFNLFILIIVLFILFYILSSLVFMLPFFKSSYKYKTKSGNYELVTNATFNQRWFNCYVTEKVKIKANDNLVYESIFKDMINDGYKDKGDNNYKRTIKLKGSCKKAKDNYKTVHDSKYLEFSLNGNYNETLEYGDNYTDPYLISKVGGNDVKTVSVLSNFNNNKLGSYVISYGLKIDDNYTKRLYRLIKVVDTKPPEIDLEGDDVITLNYGEEFKEPGYLATDNYDGDITNNVKVSGKVNKNKPGIYKITYNVSDLSGNKTKTTRKVIVKESLVSITEPVIEQKDGITYVNGILLVNKKYALPKDYDPKVNKEAYSALLKMQKDAFVLGLDLSLVSGYRSYETQEDLFEKYKEKDGEEIANTYSAKPGYSEHQTGLAFDIGSVDRSFENTIEAKWIEENAHLYGFIVRYPKGKTDVTGYIYEPWHIRYLGVDTATKVKQSGLTLEEYLNIN